MHAMVTNSERRSAAGRELRGDQFAEMVYLMLMSSDEMRGKVKALANRYGLSDVETRADVIRYLNRLATKRVKTGCGVETT
jgi:hypothetical protein